MWILNVISMQHATPTPWIMNNCIKIGAKTKDVSEHLCVCVCFVCSVHYAYLQKWMDAFLFVFILSSIKIKIHFVSFESHNELILNSRWFCAFCLLSMNKAKFEFYRMLIIHYLCRHWCLHPFYSNGNRQTKKYIVTTISTFKLWRMLVICEDVYLHRHLRCILSFVLTLIFFIRNFGYVAHPFIRSTWNFSHFFIWWNGI